jgi:hypothetical protein
LIVLLAGCWRDAPAKAPAPAAAPPPKVAARPPDQDDATLCHVWVERSRPLVEKDAPGAIDWNDIERGCVHEIDEDDGRPFVLCVNDAADDQAVKACWNTYFKLDLDLGKAFGN